MRDPDHDRVDALIRSITGASRVFDLKADADQTAALVRELLELPTITATDLTEREAVLAMMLWSKTEAAKRLLALVAMTE